MRLAAENMYLQFSSSPGYFVRTIFRWMQRILDIQIQGILIL
jgi:hypothetical protein